MGQARGGPPALVANGIGPLFGQDGQLVRRGQGLEAEMTRAEGSRAAGGSGGLAAAGLGGSYGRTGIDAGGR